MVVAAAGWAAEAAAVVVVAAGWAAGAAAGVVTAAVVGVVLVVAVVAVAGVAVVVVALAAVALVVVGAGAAFVVVAVRWTSLEVFVTVVEVVRPVFSVADFPFLAAASHGFVAAARQSVQRTGLPLKLGVPQQGSFSLSFFFFFKKKNLRFFYLEEFFFFFTGIFCCCGCLFFGLEAGEG